MGPFDLIKKIKDNFDYKIYCYGAGEFGRIVRTYLYEHNIDIDGFVISDKKKDVLRVLGKTIYSVDEVETTNALFVLSISEKYQLDVRNLLERNNVMNIIPLDNECIKEMERRLSYKYDFRETYQPLVLLYHRICNNNQDVWNISLAPSEFEKQIIWLKSNYNILKFDDEWLPVDKPSIVITFDDGYEDFYNNAYPILLKYKIPTMIFIPTGNILSREMFWWDELKELIFTSKVKKFSFMGDNYCIYTDDMRKETCIKIHKHLRVMFPSVRMQYLGMLKDILGIKMLDHYGVMSADEIREISTSEYISIGGHTVTHSSLPYLFNKIQFKEINQSKKFLEDMLRKSIYSFAYPFGDYSELVRRNVELAGYHKIACVGDGLYTGNNKEIFRHTVLANNLNDFIYEIHSVENRYGR